jgi:hypothetical protein
MYDSARAKRYFGVPNIKTPDFFPILSLLPQRALVYVKEAQSESFTQVFLDIFHAMWENGLDVSKPEVLGQVLSKRFKESEVKSILEKANSAPYKQCLNDNTKEALDRGAFGCPWYLVRNSKGEEEPFFGSDRYASLTSMFLLPSGYAMQWCVQNTCNFWYSARGGQGRCLRHQACPEHRARSNPRVSRVLTLLFRFHYMWEFLGLPWKDIELQAPMQTKAKM